MSPKVGPIALASPAGALEATSPGSRPSPAPRSAVDEAALFRAIHLRGDRWMGRFMLIHLLLAALFAPFHGTWLPALVIGGSAALVFFLARWLCPGELITRAVAGISLQAFCALHIYQMAGLAEMHFFFFTSVTAMIIYQDWRAPWPGVLAIIAQHSLFHHLHNQGIHPGGLPFFEPEYVTSLRMSLHYGIAVAQVAIASYWAHVLREQTLRDAVQRGELEGVNALLREQAAALEHANEELRDSELRFRSTFDQAAVGVAHVALDGSWVRVNDRLCEIVGYPREELLQLTFQEITHPEDLGADMERVGQVIAGEIDTYSMEKRYLRKDGSPVWANLTVSLVRGGAGEPRYFISVIEDIDGRKRIEAERDELHTAERAARQEAEAANRAKAQFLATMSHELRTPLNAIGGYTELLDMGVRGPITEEQRKDLARIRRSQQHLLSLINDVLNFARVEAGHVHYHITEVPLSSALCGVEGLILPQLQAKGLGYEYRSPDPDLVVRADRERMEQVILNLLTNAIKFTPPGGTITLEAAEAGPAVAIRVRDTGRGIPADRLEAIFEPFVQVDPSLTRENEGVGLGLAISRDLARAMGGNLTATSEVGRGSTFVLLLPRAAPVPGADAIAPGDAVMA